MLKSFTIRDSKVGSYSPPFFQHSHGEAERTFKTLTTEAQSNISKFPEDFDLYYLGDYDPQTGKLTALDTPQHVIKAIDLVQKN